MARTAALLMVVVLSGCVTLPRSAVPPEYAESATVPGMPDVRAWGGKVSPEFQQDAIESVRQKQANGNVQRDFASLSLSGGGSDGAFGAGFLNGWAQSGGRPDFKLVTGISTGALIAPFAFLGSDYDDRLKEVYTTTSTSDILEMLNVFSFLYTRQSFARATPLEKLVARHIDEELLRAVARKHAQGDRLYIGTTNMDAQRLSVWNMGRIAQYGTPEAYELFRKVMVASTSIPAAFPPVMIDVEGEDGRLYDEMHTDGGTVTQMFFYGGVLDLRETAEQRGVTDEKLGDLYVIRNGKMKPQHDQIERRVAPITDRAVATMIKAAAFNDLYRIYAFAQRDNVEFHYVGIPDDFVSTSAEPFDKEEMNRLFEIGYHEGLAGGDWKDEPPGIDIEGF